VTTPVRAHAHRFLTLYHAGEVAAAEIDDYIEAWHGSEPHVQLHVYLGLTWAEYRTWLRENWLPTAAEHALEVDDAVWLDADTEQAYLLRTHSPVRCRPPCPVHWPSDHPLAGAPLRWVREQGLMGRRCSHLTLHPDPDDQQVRLHPDLARHNCDGCCTARTVDGEFYEDDEDVSDVVRAVRRGHERGITRRPE
jgi:hypothetical protein